MRLNDRERVKRPLFSSVRVRTRFRLRTCGCEGLRGVVQPLRVVNIFDIRVNVCPTCRHVVRVVLLLGHHIVELLIETFVHALRDDLRQRLELPGFHRPVRGGDRRFRFTRRFQPRIRRTIVEMVPLEEDYDAPSQGAGPEVQFESRQRLGALESALAALSPEQREVILLREIEGLSYAEICAALDLQEGTVKSRLARAREALASVVRGTEA